MTDEDIMTRLRTQYETRVSVFPFAGGKWEKVLALDPRRVAVRFDALSAAVTDALVLPEGVQDLPFTLGFTNLPAEWKAKDWAVAVPGEWYGSATATVRIVITELLKTGG